MQQCARFHRATPKPCDIHKLLFRKPLQAEYCFAASITFESIATVCVRAAGAVVKLFRAGWPEPRTAVLDQAARIVAYGLITGHALLHPLTCGSKLAGVLVLAATAGRDHTPLSSSRS